MKKLFFTLLAAFGCLLAAAQTRSYADNASGTFVVGLDSYFYGRTGTLEFRADGKVFQVTVDGGDVSVGSSARDGAQGEVGVGVPEFTGNRVPDLVVARRNNSLVGLTLYTLSGGRWVFAATIDPIQGKEIRVFRQVVSIREGETLHSWTWHGNGFDYKRSR